MPRIKIMCSDFIIGRNGNEEEREQVMYGFGVIDLFGKFMLLLIFILFLYCQRVFLLSLTYIYYKMYKGGKK